jgi:polysaccharide export outer membrane protein
MRFFSFLFLFGFVLVLFSCKTQNVVPTNYFQQLDTSATHLLNLAEPKIQENDLLSIKVYSQSADPRTDIPYNLPEQTVAGSSNTSATAGFLVDEKGTIDYPRIGVLHVKGLTKTELAQVIKTRLENELKNPSVIIRFLNYRVTVLGEVRTPGTFSIPTERVTILEALGLAGDITEFGKRDTVRVAREINGQMRVGYVSLSSGAVFNSPYYRLQQNDVVFVEQTQRRVMQQERQNVAQQIGIATSIITAIALIVNIIR